MGNDQPKPIARVAKTQIDVAALKARIHLELFRDRKHADVIKDEKELIAKIRSKNRNKTEELLIAQRVVQGLKLASGISSATKPAICSSHMLLASGYRLSSFRKICSTLKRYNLF